MFIVHRQWSEMLDWVWARFGVNRNDPLIPTVFIVLALVIGSAGTAGLFGLGQESAFVTGKYTLSSQAAWVEIFKPDPETKVEVTMVACHPFSFFKGLDDTDAPLLSPAEARLTSCPTQEAYGFTVSDLRGRWMWNITPTVILTTDSEVVVRWGRSFPSQVSRLIVFFLAITAALLLFSHGLWERERQERNRRQEMRAAIQKATEFK